MASQVIQGAFAGTGPRLTLATRPPLPPGPRIGAPPPAAPVQRSSGGSFQVDPARLGLAPGGGQPLPAPVRARMEAALGADFAAVRVHVGPQAERIGALAFTTGNDIYFAPGRYQPHTAPGQHLLGHELAHVVQQRQGRVRAPAGGGLSVVQDNALEAEAERLGRVASGPVAVAEAVAQRTAHPRRPTSGGIVQRKPVDALTRQKLACAQAAIEYARPFITHGPQNQRWARNQYGDEGDVNMSAMIALVNRTRFDTGNPGVQEQGDYNRDWVRPRRIGAAVAATGGGNCQDIAALTYNYLREHARADWMVCFVVANDIHHAFATIGDPTADDAEDVVVADAWTRYLRACRFSEHFCRDDGNLVVHRRKPGGKVGRTQTLVGKYYATDQLPAYVTGLKTEVRLNPRAAATWNHESAIGYYERTAGHYAQVPDAQPRKVGARPLRDFVQRALSNYAARWKWNQSAASRDAVRVLSQHLDDHGPLYVAVRYYLTVNQPKPPTHIIDVGEKLRPGSSFHTDLSREFDLWKRQ